MAFNPKDSRNLVIALGLGAAAGAAVMPIVIMVEAYTAYEAAARGLDEIIRQGGRITVIQVVEQVPGREFMIKPEQILKWGFQFWRQRTTLVFGR